MMTTSYTLQLDHNAASYAINSLMR